MTLVAVADDHRLVRRGLSAILSGASDVAPAEVGSSAELFDLLSARRIDVLVMSLSFAREGLEILRQVRRLYPRLPIVVFNAQDSEVLARRALRAGASAYIHNETAPEELLKIIHHVHRGGVEGGQSFAVDTLRRMVESKTKEPHEVLSPRELEVFRKIAEGKAVGAIARELNLSVKTVSTYRSRILEKMNFSSNADIMRYALLNGPL